jgi:hypothetical protein
MNFKEEVSKSIRKELPESTSDADILSYSSLLLKKILSLPYFKGAYNYMKIYRDYNEKDNVAHYSIGHSSVNNFKNVTNQILGPNKIYFEDINDDFFQIEKKYMRVLTEKENESVSKSINLIKSTEDISDVKKYFENNKEDYYIFINYYRENNANKIGQNLISTFKNTVTLDDANLKDNYKLETYGPNLSDEFFKMDTFAVRDDFFYELNNLLSKDKDEFLNAILNPVKLSGSDFKKLLFGDSIKFLNLSGLSHSRLENDTDSEIISQEHNKRLNVLEKLRNRPKLYEDSLFKLIYETPVNLRHEKIFNDKLFENQKKDFFDKSSEMFYPQTFENIYHDLGEFMNNSFLSVLEKFPELSEDPNTVASFKVERFCKNIGVEGYDLLEYLANNQGFNLYDNLSIDFGSKNIQYLMIDHMNHSTDREENCIYVKNNNFEIVSVNHFISTSPLYEKNDDSNIMLEIMNYNEIASHFKNNEILKKLTHDEIFNYVANKKIVLDISKSGKDIPIDLLKESIEMENVFISLDGVSFDGVGVYYKGFNELRDKLFEGDISKIKKEIIGDLKPVTYDELLDIKKEYNKIYKDRFKKLENDYSNMSHDDFESNYNFDKYSFIFEVKKTSEEAIINKYTNGLKYKKQTRNKMSAK